MTAFARGPSALTAPIERVFRSGDCCHKYRILGLLGSGGMGEVYEAVDDYLERRVALKTLRVHRSHADEFLRGLRREAIVLADLNHPNIVRLYDAGVTSDGIAYLVMEKVEGKPLRVLRDAFGALDVMSALSIASQAAEALRAAHRAGVVHRDLKPENILVKEDGQIKVVDFGLARRVERPRFDSTDRLTRMGTPHYMSPEHAAGEPVHTPSDVYSLGLVLYEMLAGRHTFGEHTGDVPSRSEVAHHHLFARPRPLAEILDSSISGVSLLVQQMLSKAPQARPTADAVCRALQTEMARRDGRGTERRRALPPSVSTLAPRLVAPARGDSRRREIPRLAPPPADLARQAGPGEPPDAHRDALLPGLPPSNLRFAPGGRARGEAAFLAHLQSGGVPTPVPMISDARPVLPPPRPALAWGPVALGFLCAAVGFAVLAPAMVGAGASAASGAEPSSSSRSSVPSAPPMSPKHPVPPAQSVPLARAAPGGSSSVKTPVPAPSMSTNGKPASSATFTSSARP